VYSLLNTLHCKRCGNIWTLEKETGSLSDSETPASNRREKLATAESLETRMEKELEGYLKRFNGKFSTSTITSNLGDIHMAMFRRYLKNCVKNRTLVEKKDHYGILWYSRPD
jgi:hypothetical protein